MFRNSLVQVFRVASKSRFGITALLPKKRKATKRATHFSPFLILKLYKFKKNFPTCFLVQPAPEVPIYLFPARPKFQEFKSILDDYEVKIWLAAMDLDVSDVEELFHMLDDGQAAWRIQRKVVDQNVSHF